jgi:hypothetical protein
VLTYWVSDDYSLCVVAVAASVEDGLQLLGSPQAGIDVDLDVVVDEVSERRIGKWRFSRRRRRGQVLGRI